jgi:hypothetical protein
LGQALSERTKQQGLIITPEGEPAVIVDDLEVAQFVYLLLHNEKIRRVIDTVGNKAVPLLGRFTEGRIVVLERLREELRNRGYLPIVFNFDKPETKDFTETVRLFLGPIDDCPDNALGVHASRLDALAPKFLNSAPI